MLPEYPSDRDYFFDSEKNIYQVLGYCHPQGHVYCLHKYSPISKLSDNDFTWKSRLNSTYYKRIIPQYSSYSATNNIRNNRFKAKSELYGVDLIQFPINNIAHYFSPRNKMNSLTKRALTEFHALEDQEKYAIEISHIVDEELGIPINDIGVTGSMLWEGLHKNSDIDLVIYGVNNTWTFIKSIEKLVQSYPQLRKPSLTEQINLAHAFSRKSGMTLEDCIAFISNKKFLLYFSKYVLSIAFNPKENEIVNNTLASNDTNFINVPDLENIVLNATVGDDSWMYFYPGVIYLNEVEIQYPSNFRNPLQVCRAVIFEHENVGYYKIGSKIEIRGLIQKIKHPPFDVVSKCANRNGITEDLFQIVVGTSENYENEYVKNLEL